MRKLSVQVEEMGKALPLPTTTLDEHGYGLTDSTIFGSVVIWDVKPLSGSHSEMLLNAAGYSLAILKFKINARTTILNSFLNY